MSQPQCALSKTPTIVQYYRDSSRAGWKTENPGFQGHQETAMHRFKVHALREVLPPQMQVIRAFLADTRGHDLTEYALMAGFITVTAAAIMPTLADNVDVILSRIRIILASLVAGSAKSSL